jgi:hypothetical protein
MELNSKTVSFVLAVIIFILVNSNLVGFVLAQEPSYYDHLLKIKMFHQEFKNSIYQPIQNDDKLGILTKTISPSQTLSTEWIDKLISWQKLRSYNEQTIMNKSNPQKDVGDLVAVNSVKSRDIIYSERQENKNENDNIVDIQVKNNPRNQADAFQDDYALETFIDESVNSGIKMANKQYHSGSASEYDRLGNYLNIEVSGITVSAINSVPGGNAVADSDIIIKPVQIIISPSEVEEKIK